MAKKANIAAGKTPFHTVVEKVQRGTITDKEISEYFVAQPNPQKPFDFTVGLNRAAVDFQGVEKSSKLADALAAQPVSVACCADRVCAVVAGADLECRP